MFKSPNLSGLTINELTDLFVAELITVNEYDSAVQQEIKKFQARAIDNTRLQVRMRQERITESTVYLYNLLYG
ncbi:MAG: hypothetical protein Q8L80_13140 [Gallionella sp.]|nr:hypothetical protein [Gallionella sp.]MDP1942122.1 hypothetical protein [Gallionella sp.]